MKLERFKAAAARLFFDMINADGVIEDNEILLLEGLGEYAPVDRDGSTVDLLNFTKEANEIIRCGGLRRKYRIENDDIQESIRITTSEAVAILKEWQRHDELRHIKYDPKTVYRAENVIMDLRTISRCDGNSSIEESKLLAAVNLCLNDRGRDKFRAIPVAYRERNLRFARKEIVYLESTYDEDVNDYICRNKTLIENMMSINGYDFVYIPDVVEFLRNKAKSGLLLPILIFSKPFYYTDTKKAAEFADEVQKITTADFTGTFMAAAHLEKTLPPCLLVKVKTSTIESPDSDGCMQKTKYTDFIALPINGNVVATFRQLAEYIHDCTGGITSVVNTTLHQKLYCKGIHKTLIDYAVHKSSANIVERVIFNIKGKRKYVEFAGVDGGSVRMKPKEIVLYLVFIIYSVYGDRKGVSKREEGTAAGKKMADVFSRIYSFATDSPDDGLFKSLSVIKSNIKAKINGVVRLEDKDKYNIVDTDEYIRVNINPDKIVIRDSDNDTELPLNDWLIRHRIEV